MSENKETQKKANARSANRPATGKIKMHRYYKGICALMFNKEDSDHYKRMIVGLYKEKGQFPVG